jgi:acyl-CoA dehydrogenase
VIDRAVQSFGGEGISQNTPLAKMWAKARFLRLADGPDEVHIAQLEKRENTRGKDLLKKIK